MKCEWNKSKENKKSTKFVSGSEIIRKIKDIKRLVIKDLKNTVKDGRKLNTKQ